MLVKLRYKILGTLVVLVAAGVVTLMLVMTHTTPCGAAPPLPAGATPMKGIERGCYGPPGILKYTEVPRPTPADDEVLVRVHAASVNPLDWHYVEGTPYPVRIDRGFGKPEDPRLGVGPLSVSHLGQAPAVTISFNTRPGVSLGDAVDRIQQVARETLPDNVTSV